MTPPLFVVAREGLRSGGRVDLGGAEGHHAARVRRVRPGERVDLTDGAGLLAECVVATTGREQVALDVLAVREVPRPEPRLVVVQAVPKADRGEHAVAAMTEVGVDEVVPWHAARCVVQWRGERGRKAHERWRAAAREASKQAHRSWFPEVAEPASTGEVAARLDSAALAVVLHEDAVSPLAGATVPADGTVVVVVGPEGGLTPEELVTLAGTNLRTYRLGPTVLRTSTAGVAATAVLLAASGRWS